MNQLDTTVATNSTTIPSCNTQIRPSSGDELSDPGQFMDRLRQSACSFSELQDQSSLAATDLIFLVVAAAYYYAQLSRFRDHVDTYVRDRSVDRLKRWTFLKDGKPQFVGLLRVLLDPEKHSTTARASQLGLAAEAAYAQGLKGGKDSTEKIQEAGGYIAFGQSWKEDEAIRKALEAIQDTGEEAENTSDDDVENLGDKGNPEFTDVESSDGSTETSKSSETNDPPNSCVSETPIPLSYPPRGYSYQHPNGAKPSDNDVLLHRETIQLDGTRRQQLSPIVLPYKTLYEAIEKTEIVDALSYSLPAGLLIGLQISKEQIAKPEHLNGQIRTNESCTSISFEKTSPGKGRARSVCLCVEGILVGLEPNSAYGISSANLARLEYLLNSENREDWQVRESAVTKHSKTTFPALCATIDGKRTSIDLLTEDHAAVAETPARTNADDRVAEYELTVPDWQRFRHEINADKKKVERPSQYEFNADGLHAYVDGSTGPMASVPVKSTVSFAKSVKLDADFAKVLKIDHRYLAYGATRLTIGIYKTEFLATIALLGGEIQIAWPRGK